jgi:hypothetical protein
VQPLRVFASRPISLLLEEKLKSTSLVVVRGTRSCQEISFSYAVISSSDLIHYENVWVS